MQFNIRVSSTGKMEKESQNKRCFDLIHVYLSVNTPHFHNQLSFQMTSDKKKNQEKNTQTRHQLLFQTISFSVKVQQISVIN